MVTHKVDKVKKSYHDELFRLLQGFDKVANTFHHFHQISFSYRMEQEVHHFANSGESDKGDLNSET